MELTRLSLLHHIAIRKCLYAQCNRIARVAMRQLVIYAKEDAVKPHFHSAYVCPIHTHAHTCSSAGLLGWCGRQAFQKRFLCTQSMLLCPKYFLLGACNGGTNLTSFCSPNLQHTEYPSWGLRPDLFF